MFVKQCSIHRSRAKYIWEKKANKLQVHPYKPVSWSPTHQGIKSSKNLKYEIRAKKARKSAQNRKKIDEDAIDVV